MITNCRHLKAIVFDWAGTTVDFGSRAPVFVFREVFRRRGIDVVDSQAREPMGLAKRDHIAAIASMPDVADQWQATYKRGVEESDIDEMYTEFLPLQKQILADHSNVIDGVPEAVEQCRQLGLKIGSTTGYTRELMDVVSPIANSQGYKPDCVVCSDDVPRGRPTPFPLFEAAMRLDVYPMKSIVKVDDTTTGIEAGLNAGCWTVGVTGTGNLSGLSEQEYFGLNDEDRAQLLDHATRLLVAAGAHFTAESVRHIPSIVETIEQSFDK